MPSFTLRKAFLYYKTKNSTFKFNTERLRRSDIMLKNRHLIDPMDFTVDQLEEIFELAHQIIKNPKEYAKVCDGKILATLFYEPSTRTRFSFESAMMRLGGNILGFSEPNSRVY